MKKDKKAVKAGAADTKNKKGGKNKANLQPIREDADSFARERITAADLIPLGDDSPAAGASRSGASAPPVMPMAGGLNPVIAPSGHVQLNPVVVPVAFVPYASQDQSLYPESGPRTGVSRQAIGDQPRETGRAAAAARKDKSAGFAESEGEKTSSARKAAVMNRAFAGVMLLGGLVFILFVLLKAFADKLPVDVAMSFGIGGPDLVGDWKAFIEIMKEHGEIYIGDFVSVIAMTAITLTVLICIILSIVSLANGKGYHVWIAYLLSFVTLAVILLLGVLPKDEPVIEDLMVELDPSGLYGYHCQLCIILAILTVLGLIFWPRKAHEEEEDL